MFQNQIDKIERVQKQFTKWLSGLHKLSYKNRLAQLGPGSYYDYDYAIELWSAGSHWTYHRASAAVLNVTSK